MIGVKLQLLYNNTWNYLTVCKKELIVVYKLYIYIYIYIYLQAQGYISPLLFFWEKGFGIK